MRRKAFATMATRVCLMVMLVLAFAACNVPFGASSVSGATAIPGADGKQTFHLVLAGSSDVRGLDPATVTDTNSLSVAQLLWPTLVMLDGSFAEKPWAAERWDVSKDGLTYIFHLRQGMTFSDGKTPLDAAAFAYTLNRTVDPCTGSPAWFYLAALKDAITFNGEACVKGAYIAAAGQTQPVIKSLLNDAISVRDPQTLELKLAKPVAYFLDALSYPAAAAVPQRLIQQYHGQWTAHLAEQHFGGNLFVLTQWDHKGHLTLQRNDAFWGKKPLLQEIDVTSYPSVSAQYADWQAGKNDVGIASLDQYATAQKGQRFQETPQLDIDYVAMNWRTAPFDDVHMRQAFALALDKQALVAGVWKGAALATNHLMPQGLPAYNAKLAGPDGTPSLTGNATQAAALAQAYAKDHCNGALSTCPAVTLTVSNSDPMLKAEAQAAIQQWKRVLPGYPISLSVVDPTTFLTALAGNVNSGKTLQSWVSNWVADYPDPQEWLTLQFLPSSPYNAGNVDVRDANSLMQRADLGGDPVQRIHDYQAAEQLLVTQVAWVPLDQPKLWWETRSYVQGFSIGAAGFTPLDVWQGVFIAAH
ncbi:MAG: peptide ABC transporter substrate-binding protein [Ktedonobacterales bacterium]